MQLRKSVKLLYSGYLLKTSHVSHVGSRWLQNYLPTFENGSQRADRPKLRIMEKSPQYPPNLRPPKMQKKLKLLRGPEETQSNLLYGQWGIIALGGGRLNAGHFEMLRLTIGRKMDVNRMFAVWRVPPPWQPITKKGLGQRMGGGKGPIDHYETPVKRNRVLIEIGGNCEYAEVKHVLQQVCLQLPFKAVVVSQNELNEYLEENSYPFKSCHSFSLQYVIQNNFNNCHAWLCKMDHKWFGKYMRLFQSRRLLNPFDNIETAESSQLQEELIDLTTNEELKIKFKKSYHEFWLQKSIAQLYPYLWSIVQRFLIAFPSSYLSERAFSAVTTLLTKKRNQLHTTERGDLRLFLSKLNPDVTKLLKQHKVHPSH